VVVNLVSSPDRRVVVTALICVCALGGAPRAQTPRPMTLLELIGTPRVNDPQLSPEGATVVYTLLTADWKANRQVPHIWRQAATGGPPVRLTTGETGESFGRWSPDGRSISFLSPGGEAGMQIFVVPAEGGEASALSRHATSVSQPAWAPDGRAIYFVAADARTAAERERERLRDDLYGFEENVKPRHLWRISVEDGVEQKLTDGPFSILSYRVARDGRQIVTQRAPTPLVADNVRSEVWVMDADGGRARAVTANDIEEVDAELSPDNTRLLFLAEANERLEPYYSSALFVVPAEGGQPRLLLPDFPHAIERATWSPDGQAILAVVNKGVTSEIFRIDVATRTARAMTEGRHSVQFWSLSPLARRMIFQLDEETRLGDAWTLAADAGAGVPPARVTGVYDALARDFYLPRQERIAWTGADGVAIEGVLFYPIRYERGRRYPLIVQMHGGPQESDKFGLGPGVIVNYVPVLAAKGYAVLRPNYRGSTGYGSAFLRDVIGGYFKNMHLDVLAGVDALVERGVADPNRLGLMGWSAGAHLTNKLITMTNRFKAASSTAGAANWTSLYAQTDSRAHRTLWFGGPPWQPEAAGAYWEHSPLKDAARVRTPTLFFAGQDDARVPMAQAVEMYRALKANDVPTKLLIAPREGHQWGELRHQLAKANAELEWFEHYLSNRAHTWELPPGDVLGR
jgi:dipeptidyl aminopeptidase/acylaminoacyl peptidase